jgi:hypothetical protein
MKNAKLIGRLGLLTVGVGIGAAVAQTPIASADSPTDWLSSIDSLAGAALPAAPSSGLDLAISFDGYSLFHDGSAVADTGLAGNGNFDFAIAYGDGAIANAYGGIGDYALAEGTNAFSNAGGGTGANFDNAIDIGNNDVPSSVYTDGAFAGDADLVGNTSGGTGSYDTAIDIGNNSGYDAAWAGNSDLNGGTDGGTGSGDTAIDIGNNSEFFDGSVAGAGGLVGGVGNGNGDTAIDVGNNSGGVDGPWAVAGNDNYASFFGDATSVGEGAVAGDGDSNIADSVGLNAYTFADGGNSNIAYVFDPLGTGAGSEADAGAYGNSDLAAVFGDGLTSNSATNGDFLYDILSPAGDLPGSAAATSGGFLAELLALF